ncbi:MRG-domain-containing protein [Scenedesmus sp. NREL 46B-D3]|nr:MRG-domain-containing protein [Scenedesmus sp. NREL 46B-D3]
MLSSVAVHAGSEPVEVQLDVELPAALQKQLLDQYDAMHDEGRTVALPRRPNVAQILQGYVQYVYFDKALYQCLLYRPERQQAQQALGAGQAPSVVYGAEHLLRLFVKLPELLPPTGAPEEQLQLLLQRVEDLLVYLQHQSSKIFAPLSEYVPFSSVAAPAGVGAVRGSGGWANPAKQQQQQQVLQ